MPLPSCVNSQPEPSSVKINDYRQWYELKKWNLPMQAGADTYDSLR